MSHFRFSVCIASLFLVFGLACTLPIHGTTPAKPKGPPPMDPRILVTAVDVPNQQITITYKRTGQKVKYGVDFMTHVTVDNNPGSLKDVKVGQQIFDYVARDAHSLDVLTVGIANPAPH
jgi:hypothetical protein